MLLLEFVLRTRHEFSIGLPWFHLLDLVGESSTEPIVDASVV